MKVIHTRDSWAKGGETLFLHCMPFPNILTHSGQRERGPSSLVGLHLGKRSFEGYEMGRDDNIMNLVRKKRRKGMKTPFEFKRGIYTCTICKLSKPWENRKEYSGKRSIRGEAMDST